MRQLEYYTIYTRKSQQKNDSFFAFFKKIEDIWRIAHILRTDKKTTAIYSGSCPSPLPQIQAPCSRFSRNFGVCTEKESFAEAAAAADKPAAPSKAADLSAPLPQCLLKELPHPALKKPPDHTVGRSVRSATISLCYRDRRKAARAAAPARAVPAPSARRDPAV